jgi:hypothetical protein
LAFSSYQTKEKKKKHKEKKNHREKEKMQRREGVYLCSLAFAFGMKRSSCFLLSTFLQC